MHAAAVNPQGTGTSGGVAVAARTHLGLARSPVEVDARYRARVIVAWVGAGLRGGLHLVSVYLFPSEGLSDRNRVLLEEVARLVTTVRGPWLVGGDFQMSPDQLRASGWVAWVGGRVFCAGQPTCTSAVEGAELDYFVGMEELSVAVGNAEVLHGGPHQAA